MASYLYHIYLILVLSQQSGTQTISSDRKVGASQKPTKEATNSGALVGPKIDINCGGPSVGRFAGEDPAWIYGKTDINPGSPSFFIKGAGDRNAPGLVSHRWGVGKSKWGYNIPLRQPGVYDCTLHFAETSDFFFKVGKRVFDIQVMDRKVTALDIFKEAGGPYTSVVRTFSSLQIRESLRIELTAVKGNAFLSAITCKKIEEKPKNALNINCGGGGVGRFAADNSAWVRGDTRINSGDNVDDIFGAESKNRPALFSHRWGRRGSAWGYTIPVEQPGLYDCSLHFAETSPFFFEEGGRVFHAKVMDKTIPSIDVYAEAGGPFRSIVKTFPDLNINDKLQIDLTPTTGDPFLAAITCEKAVEDTNGPKENGQLIIGGKSEETEVIRCTADSLFVRVKDLSSISPGNIIWNVPSGQSHVFTGCDFIARKIVKLRQVTNVVRQATGATCPVGETCLEIETEYATFSDLFSSTILKQWGLEVNSFGKKAFELFFNTLNCLLLPGTSRQDTQERPTKRQVLQIPKTCFGWNRLDSDGRCVFSDCFVGVDGDPRLCLPSENGCGPKDPILNFLVPDAVPFVFDFRETCCIHDKCYTSHSFSQEECDCEFLRGNLASCTDELSDILYQIPLPIKVIGSRMRCPVAALLYYVSVAAAGKTSFEDAQKEREEHEKKDFCAAKCPSTQKSGGRGTTSLTVDLKKTSGTFEVYYDMYSIKDGMEIFYEGNVIYQTQSQDGGILVSGSKTVPVTYSGKSTFIQVKVSAPTSGTSWRVRVDCPP